MDTALLIVHVIIGLLFMGHGTLKLRDLGGTTEYMESLGLRPARFHALAAGASELAAGVLIALGLVVPAAAALVTAVMVTAALTEHRGKPIWVDAGGAELPLVMTAIAFLLTAAGGAYTLDAELGIDAAGLGWAAAAVGAGVLGALGNLALARVSSSRRRPAVA